MIIKFVFGVGKSYPHTRTKFFFDVPVDVAEFKLSDGMCND